MSRYSGNPIREHIEWSGWIGKDTVTQTGLTYLNIVPVISKLHLWYFIFRVCLDVLYLGFVLVTSVQMSQCIRKRWKSLQKTQRGMDLKKITLTTPPPPKKEKKQNKKQNKNKKTLDKNN